MGSAEQASNVVAEMLIRFGEMPVPDGMALAARLVASVSGVMSTSTDPDAAWQALVDASVEAPEAVWSVTDEGVLTETLQVWASGIVAGTGAFGESADTYVVALDEVLLGMQGLADAARLVVAEGDEETADWLMSAVGSFGLLTFGQVPSVSWYPGSDDQLSNIRFPLIPATIVVLDSVESTMVGRVLMDAISVLDGLDVSRLTVPEDMLTGPGAHGGTARFESGCPCHTCDAYGGSADVEPITVGELVSSTRELFEHVLERVRPLASTGVLEGLPAIPDDYAELRALLDAAPRIGNGEDHDTWLNVFAPVVENGVFADGTSVLFVEVDGNSAVETAWQLLLDADEYCVDVDSVPRGETPSNHPYVMLHVYAFEEGADEDAHPPSMLIPVCLECHPWAAAAFAEGRPVMVAKDGGPSDSHVILGIDVDDFEEAARIARGDE